MSGPSVTATTASGAAIGGNFASPPRNTKVDLDELRGGAFRFASPDSFDVDGDWDGGAITGHELFSFTVLHRSVVSVSCWTSGTVTLSPPVPISDGAFSFSNKGGIKVSGIVVSPTEAKGFATVGPCVGADWYATKR